MWAFEIEDIHKKIESVRKNADTALHRPPKLLFPDEPARAEQVLEFKLHPPKLGLSQKEGQARMLHDLASIELQAMELGLRTLLEYPEALPEFKEELLDLTLSESRHLEMCLIEIESLGFKWGDWPVNCGLWRAVSSEDSLLDRIALVHRYLEGSGLDAGEVLLRRLKGVGAQGAQTAVEVITREEVDHVFFGSKWYKNVCRAEGIEDSEADFIKRMNGLRKRLPKRITPIARDLRTKAGFSSTEIQYLEQLRESFFEKESEFRRTT